MTENKSLKRAVRARAAKTGESYSTALRALRASGVVADAPLRRLERPGLGFALSIPGDWIERAPDHSKGPQVARWLGPGRPFRNAVVFRYEAGPQREPLGIAEAAGEQLSRNGYERKGLTRLRFAGRDGARLDLVQASSDQCWTVRQHFVISLEQVLVLSIGTWRAQQDAHLFDAIASSFELIESDARTAAHLPSPDWHHRPEIAAVVARGARAAEIRHSWWGSEHLLLGIVQLQTGIGSEVLRDLELTELQLIAQIGRMSTPPQGERAGSVRTREVERLLAHGMYSCAARLGHGYVGTEHLLLAMMEAPQGRARHLLCSLGVEEETIRRHLGERMAEELRRSAASPNGAYGRGARSGAFAWPGRARPSAHGQTAFREVLQNESRDQPNRVDNSRRPLPGEPRSRRLPLKPELRRIERPDLGFSVSLPLDWIERAPDRSTRPQVARWVGSRHPLRFAVVFRNGLSVLSSPLRIAEVAAERFIANGFAVQALRPFRVAGKRGARLDVVRDGGARPRTVREYFVVNEEEIFVLKLGSATASAHGRLFDAIAASFECSNADARHGAVRPIPEWRYRPLARAALEQAPRLASATYDQRFVGSEHLLMALSTAERGVASEALRRVGLTPSILDPALRRLAAPRDEERVGATRTQELERLLARGISGCATRLGNDYVGEEHVLAALLEDPVGRARSMISCLIAETELRDALADLLAMRLHARLRTWC